MEISINQKSGEVPEHCSVQQFLSTLFPQTAKGIAIAINQAVVPKSDWETRILKPQDQITLIRATQGG